LLEVRKDGATGAQEQYVWSLRYIDSPVLRDRDADGNAATGGLGAAASGMEQRVYYLTDGNFNVTALAGTDGAILERYAYDAYGQARVFDPNWAARQSSSYANAILFCGYFRDAETGMYHVRHRYYHPQLGRWMSRDPLGYVNGMGLYEYCIGIPTGFNDPSGLDIWLEGDSEGEPWGHMSLCVGKRNGIYSAYSFGLTSNWHMLIPFPWRKGEVYRDRQLGGDIVGGDERPLIPTSEAQDSWARSELEGQVYDKHTYGISWPNCRTWSENMYDKFKAKLPTTEKPKPGVPTFNGMDPVTPDDILGYDPLYPFM